MFGRIAVVNRGEPAVRLIRAVRELNAEHGTGTRVIALHTEAERRADVRPRRRRGGAAAQDRPCESVPRPRGARTRPAQLPRRRGVGRLGIRRRGPRLRRAVRPRSGVTFIGPAPQAMRRLGDKIEAKLLAEQAGVPVAPWSGGPVEDARGRPPARGRDRLPADHQGPQRRRRAAASAGVRSRGELDDALERTQAEAQRAFGDPVVFMEQLVEGGRHVEVQVIADEHGKVWAPGRPRLLDPAPQPEGDRGVQLPGADARSRTPSSRRGRRRWSGAPATAAPAPSSSCTSRSDELFAFLEVNTRLQVEHPITEATTGLDLVKLQLHVADGGRLEGDAAAERGHAIEARLNAEDADSGFAPVAGHGRAADAADRPRRPGGHRHRRRAT